MKLLLALLIIANLVLVGWFEGWLSPYGGDGREPDRMRREVMPERLRTLPDPAGPLRRNVGPTGASGASESQESGEPRSPQESQENTPPQGPSGPSAPPASPAGPSAPAAPGVALAMPPEAPVNSVLQAGVAPAPWVSAGCVELAPLTEAQALSVQTALAGQPVSAAMLLPAGAESWWVYLLPAQGDAQALLETLRARGLSEEAVLMREGPMRGAIVLGRYREPSNAITLQRRLILAGQPAVRIAARGGPPGTTVLRLQAAEAPALRVAAQTGAGPLRVAAVPFSEGLATALDRQRDALRTTALAVGFRPCPQDQAAAFSSRR